REHWWRFTTGRKVYLLTAIISFAVAGLIYLSGINANAYPLLGAVVKYAGVFIGIWSSVLLVSRSLLSGSARSAQSFVETAGDPMERICRHFRDLVGWLGNNPVVVFIDDLDRCQPK